MDTVSIALKPEEIMKLTMIVTDEDKDEALTFLKVIEQRVKQAQQSHCKPAV